MMRRTWNPGRLAVIALALAGMPLAAGATPVVYTVSSGGLDGSFICQLSSQCNSGTGTAFTYSPPGAGFDAATGTITLDTTAHTLSVSLAVASATFLDTAGPVNGIDEIDFTSVTYSSTLSYTDYGGGFFLVNAAQSASVSGSYEQKLSGGTVVASAPFSAPAANVSAGQCVLVGNALNCGLKFGPGSFSIGVGSSPISEKVLHTFNLVAVPEPGSAALVLLGLSGVALRSRRAH